MRRRLMVLVMALTLGLGFAWGSQAVDQAGIVWGGDQRAVQPSGFPPQASVIWGTNAQAGVIWGA